MVFPGHIAAGYLVAYGVVHMTGISLAGSEQTFLLIAGTVLGDAPDSDIFFSFLRKKSTQPAALVGHRDHITHAPVLWLAIGLSVYVLSTTPLMQALGLLLWLCPWSHLLMDSIYTNTGIRWLWPLMNRRFYFLKREDTHFSNWKDLLLEYLSNPLFYAEAAVTICALAVFLSSI